MSPDTELANLRLPEGRRHALPPSRRASAEKMRADAERARRSPVAGALLDAVDAALLLLNEERQIAAFNARAAEIGGGKQMLGARPGEVVACVNAEESEGCGSAPACEVCGALGAVLESEVRGLPVEAECRIQRRREAGGALELNVRATPLAIEDGRFTVVSLRDISAERRHLALEQIFFHDVLNTVAGLRGWATVLRSPRGNAPRALERIELLARKLEREIVDQRALLLAESGALVPVSKPVRAADLFRELELVFSSHHSLDERTLRLEPPAPGLELSTDGPLLLRVLGNMVKNALEATPPGGAVRAWSEPALHPRAASAVRFSVHNGGFIPPEVQAGIFRRAFSTKAERGRGLGTYSMKLLGEQYLGGVVAFETAPGAGTVFSILLPAEPPAGE